VARIDPVERQADLVLLLLGARHPVTLNQIVAEVPGYPEGRDARRQAFERDKRLLREEGIEILVEEVGGQEQSGYRIDPSRFFLPTLDLEPAEQVALALAVAAADQLGGAGAAALAKLGLATAMAAPPLLSLEPVPHLAALFDAVRAQAVVRFDYAGEARTVAPAKLRFADGRWYLEGWSLERDAPRRYRVDRLESAPRIDDPGSAAAFSDLAATGAQDLSDHVELTVLVDAPAAPRVVATLGEARVVETRADGAVVVTPGLAASTLARAWVLGLGPQAEILGPEIEVANLIAWLEATRGPRPDPGPPPPLVAETPSDAQRLSAGRLRLRRLLAMVTWLAQVGETSIDALASRFGLDPEAAVAELELAACCGSPPYTPDVLLDILIDGDRVVATLPTELAQPRRLTREEGFVLAAAAHGVVELEGSEDSPLRRATAKLDAALGAEAVLEVQVDGADRVAQVRRALRDGQRLEITYYSPGRDESTVRTIHPISVHVVDGHGYVEAFCEAAGEVRFFRTDRIEALEETGPRLEELPAPVEHFAPTAWLESAPRVRMFLEPEAAWVADTLPVLSSQRVDAGVWVELAVASTAWFSRLLLQLGPHATVVEPAELQALAAEAADEVLARYLAHR